jgi:hypothetical protein
MATKYIYPLATKYTKWLWIVPNCHTVYSHSLFQGLPKCIQIENFGMQICHLATLGRILE